MFTQVFSQFFSFHLLPKAPHVVKQLLVIYKCALFCKEQILVILINCSILFLDATLFLVDFSVALCNLKVALSFDSIFFFKYVHMCFNTIATWSLTCLYPSGWSM